MQCQYLHNYTDAELPLNCLLFLKIVIVTHSRLTFYKTTVYVDVLLNCLMQDAVYSLVIIT